jgi:multiple sugar transport system ATP-binding protein
MVYVTHDQVEAMTLATRIVVMQAGRIQQIGAPAEVYERPVNRFVAGFLGAPGMNFVDGTLALRAGVPAFDAPALTLDLGAYRFTEAPRDGSPVVVGIRPEHLTIAARGEWPGRVQLVEPMGNHQVVWIEHAGLNLAVVMHELQPLRAGDEVRFDLDRTRLSLFERDSGRRL